MTTEPQQPVDEPDTTPALAPAPPARARRGPSAALLAGLAGAFLLGGLICGGLGVAAGVVIGHHHGHGFDERHHDRGPRGGVREGDRFERQRFDSERVPPELRERLRERLRQRGLGDQPLPWPLPLPGAPGAPVPPAMPTPAPTTTP